MDTPTHVHDTPRPTTEPAPAPATHSAALPAATSMNGITMHSITAAALTSTSTTRPTLLPAFEPFSSSPALPRPAKRKFAETLDEEELAAAAAAATAARKSYPTPIPTSSTGILPSSPPARRTRPGLQRTVSTLSERVPLNDVPSLELPSSGEPLLMGRSSNSSDYQLSSHRNISRVHVRARYRAPSPLHPRGTLEVECLGWNGVKVQTRRGAEKIVELAKGEKYLEEIFDQPVVLDVQDTRVMLVWPKDLPREPTAALLSSAAVSAVEEPGSPWSAESPSRSAMLMSHAQFGSSPPLLVPGRQISPVSPRRGLDFGATFTSTFRDADADDDGLVQIYEDRPGDDDEDEDAPHDPIPVPGTPTPKPAVLSKVASIKKSLQQSPSCVAAASDPEDLSEHDEENDPIVHSFYNAGENLLSRFQSFQPSSPDQRKRKPLHQATANSPGRVQQRSFTAGGNGAAISPRKPAAAAARPNWSPVRNHVINQLAFSRIHSLPLSTIHSNLPAELRAAAASSPSSTPAVSASASADLTPTDLQSLLLDIPCVGEIRREGKDAAGKLLESEFYYVPEMDPDVNRRETVTMSLGKTSIRAARKSHKQYYWKRPRH